MHSGVAVRYRRVTGVGLALVSSTSSGLPPWQSLTVNKDRLLFSQLLRQCVVWSEVDTCCCCCKGSIWSIINGSIDYRWYLLKITSAIFAPLMAS